ncbi:hypothetical protein CR513_01774, partial [Mucuna pruriens]
MFSTHVAMLQVDYFQRCKLKAGGETEASYLGTSLTIQVVMVSLAFTLGKYEDEVLCDGEPMEVPHILLGRRWQYDRKVTYDRVTNKFMLPSSLYHLNRYRKVTHDGAINRFTFVHRGQKVTLKSLSPKEVNEDELKMKLRREKGKKRTKEEGERK